MRCVNHPETEATSFCQNCGKALCASCVRTTASGQILCEPCLAAGAANPAQAYWQAAQAFVTPPPGTPNPSAAALLGLIPGVGAMYNGQLFKGLIHVVIFAVLVSITDHYGIFGIFVGAWVLYQSFEAYHTAKARRDGLPVPDPFGLNELGSWLNLGGHPGGSGPQGPAPGTGAAPGVPPAGFTPGAAAPEPPPYTPPYPAGWSNEPAAGTTGSPTAGYPPPQPPYTDPYTGPYGTSGWNPTTGYTGWQPDPSQWGGVNPPPPGTYPPGYIPPVPPAPAVRPFGYRGREPVWAFILIGLGIIFLLQSVHIFSHVFHYIWPILLIGAGVWLIVRRTGFKQGGSK